MHLILTKYVLAKCSMVCKCRYLQISRSRYFCTLENVFSREKDVNISLREKYHPEEVESHWYEWWESKNYFKPKSETDSFTVLLPPPNVTGTLHLGHALTLTIQDVILRWKRMKGESVLWVPGIDHAGIATQSVVEKYLKETEGLSKHCLGREEFLKRIEEWKDEKGKDIILQLRKMGASLDWDRLIYTMDPTHSEIVTKSFIQLYNDGLIYRKKDLVNWSCALNSSVSDIEVNYVAVHKRTKLSVPGYEQPVDFGVLYKFAYKVCDEDEEIVVATTRPETMLGDVAIAVHPDSPFHSKFINKHVWHPFRKEKIPVIADSAADPEFGTGAVKITPAHSATDHEVGVRHNLKMIDVIGDDGVMLKVGDNERFHGLRRYDARSAMIEELNRLGLYRGCSAHSTKIPICSRSGDVIESLLKSQWFLKCGPLSEKAVDAVESGELRLEPKSYWNVWMDWLKTKSGRDWNLSRQLWWGHRIPMYKCRFEGQEKWLAGRSVEEAKAKAAESFGVAAEGVEAVRDPDVLDTWFSSGLLPLNPAVYRGKGPPISLMVTGHDILFFWVARMVMLSVHLTGELPFKDVFLHSLICDAKGKKMSKSLGNVISPEDIIKGISLEEMKKRLERNAAIGVISQKNFLDALNTQKKMFPNGIPECGVDGLRFTLCSSQYRSSFVNYDIDLCRSSRFFCNKVYQAMNYFTRVAQKYRKTRGEFDLAELRSSGERENLNAFDRWILSRLNAVIAIMGESFESYTFSVGTAAIRSFIVEDLCSSYLESTKITIADASPLECRRTVSVLFHCLETSLRLLAPLMPFLSEHLYHALPSLEGFRRCESVTVAPFPRPDDWKEFRDVRLEDHFERISCLLSVLRKAKELLHLRVTQPNVFVECPDGMAEILFGDVEHVFSKMAGVRKLSRVAEDAQKSNVLPQRIADDCTAFVEHQYSQATLEKLLSLEINREKSLKDSLQKLLSKSETESSESNKMNLRYQVQMKKIRILKSELVRIEELKQAIELCNY